MSANYFGAAFAEDRLAQATVYEPQRPVAIEYFNGGQTIDRPVEYVKYVDRPLKVEDAKVEEGGFGHDVYELVLKPIGQGLAAPVVGVAALAGGVAWGALSLTRGVLGTIPIAIDYVVKPVNGALVGGVGKVDDSMRWALDGHNFDGHQFHSHADRPAVKMLSDNYQYAQTSSSLQPRIVEFDQVYRGPAWESPSYIQDQYRAPVGYAELPSYRASVTPGASMSFPATTGQGSVRIAPTTQSTSMATAVLSTPVSRVATPTTNFVAPTARIQSEAYFAPSGGPATLKMR